MAWSIINPIGSYQPITETSTTKRHPLGLRVQAEDPTYGVGEFIYCTGVASTIATDWVTINMDAFTTVRLVADAVGPVGVAMSANVASQYGWYQIYGKAIGGSNGAIVDGAAIYIAGTSLVDDAVTDGDMVHNALCRSTVGGAAITGEYQLAYPYTDNITTND
jgi:hypothetical protein